MPVDEKEESRLSRWSRRKLAETEEESSVEVAVNAGDQENEHEIELQANRDAAEAIDLESLTAESDFSVFMKEGVPKLLKRKALATLWRSNPVFANVDGLVDYDDDFGSPDLIMKTFKSAYQAGRGYLEHVERLAKLDAEAVEDEVTAAELVNSPVQEVADEDNIESIDELEEEVCG